MKVKRPLGRVPAFSPGGLDGAAEPQGGGFGLQVKAGRRQVSKVLAQAAFVMM